MKNRTPLIPLLALSLLAAPAFAAEYEISTLEELREFMEAVHVEDFAGDTITLTADIDCERGGGSTPATRSIPARSAGRSTAAGT